MPLSAPELITAAKDIILACAGATGAWVAVRGLNTWNRQLRGTAEYDLARRLLKSSYRLREALAGVRNPVMWPSEMPPPPEELKKSMSADEARFYSQGHAYQARFDHVSTARNDLQAELLEAEVLWDANVHSLFQPLYALQGELFATFHAFLSSINPRTGPSMQESHRKTLAGRRDILYEVEDDDFKLEVNRAIAAIESALKVHLRR